MGLILIIAALGSGLTGTLGAAHLLFGMGRDGVLPKTVFAYLKPGSNPPTYIILIGLLAFAGAVLLNYFGGTYQHAGELLKFGAFLVMGVNLAVFWQFTVVARPGHKRRWLRDAVLPLFGFVFCGLIWWNLNSLAKLAGAVWFAIGVIYIGIKTRGFRSAPAMIDFSE